MRLITAYLLFIPVTYGTSLAHAVLGTVQFTKEEIQRKSLKLKSGWRRWIVSNMMVLTYVRNTCFPYLTVWTKSQVFLTQYQSYLGESCKLWVTFRIIFALSVSLPNIIHVCLSPKHHTHTHTETLFSLSWVFFSPFLNFKITEPQNY